MEDTTIKVNGQMVDLKSFSIETLVKARDAMRMILESRTLAYSFENSKDHFGFEMGNEMFLERLERAIDAKQFPQKYEY